ncbi:MAG: family 20 glycosylhydrolase [Clostridia bacterium]|nr:family 20 glycosylhydrolase [Clostridia bacterium]
MNFHLIPAPFKIEVIDRGASIRREELRISEDLKRYVKKAEEAFPESGRLEIKLNVCGSLSKEEYLLKVSPLGAEISASQPNGAYYALMTLVQLFDLNDGEICHLRIEDKPTMPLRGISDDISRGQISTMSNFKDIIRRMSYVKCNVYMPYIEDTFEFKKYPESGKFSDPVTQEEWKEIIEYAKDYYIDIIPIFNTIGHWDKNAKLEAFYPYVIKENDDENGLPCTSVDVRKPESQKMINEMLDELASVFGESRAIHVGGDEVGDYTRLFKKELAGKYYNEHFNRVHDYLKEKGIHTYMYSDMYTPLYGDYALGIDYIDQMPEDMNFVFWDYAVRKDYPNIRNLIDRRKKFCLSPATYTWNRMLPQHYISFLNTKSLAEHGSENARGIIMSAWNDGGLALREENWMGIYTGALFSWSCHSDISFEEMVKSYFKLFFGVDVDMDEYNRLMNYDRNFVNHPYDDQKYEGKIEFWYDQWQNGGSMLLKEFLKDAKEPADENIRQKLSGAEDIFRKAYAYFSALKPERNQFAYDAFLFDVKRSLIASQKILLPQGNALTAEKIDWMLEKLSGLKQEHKERWFDCNRRSEWSKVEAKYDALIESFREIRK